MFENIHHVALVVRDIDEARSHLEDVYGLECTGTNDEDHRERYGIDAAFFRAGGSWLELISPFTDEGWAAEYLAENGEGFFHIAYEVDDVRERVAELKDRGIRFRNDEPQPGFEGEIVTLDSEDTIIPTQLVEV